MWQRIADRHGLGTWERDHLQSLAEELSRVPARWRGQMLDEAAEHLAEREPAASPAELRRGLGSPEAHAGRLRAAAGRDGPIGVVDRLAASRWTTRCVVVIGVLGILATAVVQRRDEPVPEFTNSCEGIKASDVVTSEAAGAIEYAVPADAAGRVGISLCPWTREEGVQILGVAAPRWPTPLVEVGVEVTFADQVSDGSIGGLPVAGDADPVELPWFVVWFEREPCHGFGPGSAWSEAAATLVYRWRGRIGTAQIPLGVGQPTELRVEIALDHVKPADCDRGIEAFRSALGSAGPEGTHGPEGWTAVMLALDLCRALDGDPGTGADGESFVGDLDEWESGRREIGPVDGGGVRHTAAVPPAREPLAERALFRTGEDVEVTEPIARAALRELCPRHDARLAEVLATLSEVSE